MTRTLVLTTALTFVAAFAHAGGGKGSYKKRARPPEEAAPNSLGVVAPQSQGIAAPGAVRAESPDDISLGKPIKFHNMSLVPVMNRREGPFQRYTLFEAGLKKRSLAVREMKGNSNQARVSEVEVRNTGKDPVYLLGGEMILGGKQDRIISRDTVVPGDSKWATVSVFCVERGRWNGGRMKFEAGGALADASVRKAAMGGSQSDVWSEVDKKHVLHGTQSKTSTYRRTIQNARVRGKIKPYVRQITAQLPTDRNSIAGLVFAINGRVHVADVFGNPVLFSELSEKLLSSYVLEALGHQVDPNRTPLSADDAGSFLQRSRRVKAKAGKRAGRAIGYGKENAEMVGTETIDTKTNQKVRESYIAK